MSTSAAQRSSVWQEFQPLRDGIRESSPVRPEGEPRQVQRNLAAWLVFNTIIAMANERDGDAELMLRFNRGDSAAFRELVERYKQPVINVACRMLHDLAEAEDLAQNVFLQVFKSAHRYHPSAKFSTWLFTIVRNLCLNEIRRRSRHPAESFESRSDDGEEPMSRQIEDTSARGPSQSALQTELEDKIQEALDALPENQRLALLLCRQDELSYEEIAKILGCSLSATKSLIHRGRETLRERLKPYLRSGLWQVSEDSAP